jgi:hypothetical protein
MGRKIRLTESEFHALVRRLVKETQDEMMDTEMDMEDTNMDMGNEDGDELSKGDVVKLISKFFKREVLPELEPQETAKLKQMAKRADTNELTEMYLNENLGDRFKSFKEKAMIGGGLGTMLTGMITSLGNFTGWSDSELTNKIHDFVEGFGGGRYSGPITMAMVFAGLVLALKGVADRHSRLNP